MNILIIGASGTIGKAIVNELQPRHTIITVGHTQGDLQVDITDPTSIETMYQQAGKIDAVISAVGKVKFADFSRMTADDYYYGLRDKLMGQVNLVLIGKNYINEHGSFTLTTGILAEEPIKTGSSASMVNMALHGFVTGAAIEMPKGIRINVVSPTVITEAMPKYAAYFPGFEPVSAARAALAYSRSAEGLETGKIYRVGY